MLPGIDDGAKSIPHALEMAAVAVQSGMTEIILTPHHNDGMYVNQREDIIDACARFQRELDRAAVPLVVHPGSELHVVPELPEHLKRGIACTYANQNRAVLLELPKHTLPGGSEQIIEQIAYMGLTPVIAHPERNSVLCSEPERIREWVERGWKFQLTNQSCSGEFGKEIQKVCRYWLAHGWINFIASDAHRVRGRSPNMRKGVQQIASWFGDDAAYLLADENPRRLLVGESIVSMPAQLRGVKKWGKRSWYTPWK